MVVEDERIKALLDDTSKVTVLPAWDPMGALAE
jgi:aminopeptidase C